MSKRKRRHREDRRQSQGINNIGNNMPFGINPAQFMNLLGNNVDLNQMGNILSSMQMDGVDLNNFNLNQGNNNQANTTERDFQPVQGIMNNLGFGEFNRTSNMTDSESNNEKSDDLVNNKNEELNEVNKEDSIEEEFLEEDENIQMLIAIKSIVDSKKAIFLDKVIEAYNKGNFKL